jgi:hypothetical protein
MPIVSFHWKFSLICFETFWYQQSHIYTKAAKRSIKNYGFSRISQFSIPKKNPIKSHNKISNRKTFRSPKNIYFSRIGPTRTLNKNVKYCLVCVQLQLVDVSKTFRLASSNLIWNVIFCDQNYVKCQKVLLSFPIYFWGMGGLERDLFGIDNVMFWWGFPGAFFPTETNSRLIKFK